MGFIQSNHSVIMYNNTMISFNMMEVARIEGIKRYAVFLFRRKLLTGHLERHSSLVNSYLVVQVLLRLQRMHLPRKQTAGHGD